MNVNNWSAIADILVLIFSPCISYMIYDFMQKGMILSFVGEFVFKEVWYNENIEDESKKIKEPKWKKPLGACLKCFHVWIFILIYILQRIEILHIQSMLYFITLLAVSYVILFRLFYR